MFVAMAGLPGSGKSTLAVRLAGALGGVVLSKDVVRAALFPPPALDYSREQDDLTLAAIYTAAIRIVTTQPGRIVVIDGRTFSRGYQVRDLSAAAGAVGLTPAVIECVCSDDVARGRLERDHAAGTHPAGNRTFDLYLAVKASAEPLTIPRLTLDTGALPLDECVRRSLEHLGRVNLSPPAAPPTRNPSTGPTL